MKSLKLILSAAALVLGCDACKILVPYVHNTVQTPAFDTLYSHELEADASLNHLGVGFAKNPLKHVNVLGSGMVTVFGGGLGLYGDFGAGYTTKLHPNVYVGSYYTLGLGVSDPVRKGVDLFDWKDDGSWEKISCNYLKNNVSTYVKFKKEDVSAYIALRASLVYFDKYQYTAYEPAHPATGGGFLSSSGPTPEKYNRYSLPKFAQWTYEPIIGIEAKIKGNSSMFLQGMVLVAPNTQMFSIPAQVPYKKITIRVGRSWTF